MLVNILKNIYSYILYKNTSYYQVKPLTLMIIWDIRFYIYIHIYLFILFL